MITELFQQALHIGSPWFIKSVDFDVEKRNLMFMWTLSEAVLF